MRSLDQRIASCWASIARGKAALAILPVDSAGAMLWRKSQASNLERIGRLEHRILMGRLEP